MNRSIWGALVGDACGATLEFICTDLTEEQVEYAMTLPGGGVHRVGKGQITDDGELTLALWNAIKDRDLTAGFPRLDVAHAYAMWYHSTPFDIGGTCSFAFEQFHDAMEANELTEKLPLLLREIVSASEGSEANGAMMRSTPLAVWWATHPLSTVEETAQRAGNMAKEDALLSHPRRVTQDANAMYVYLLTHLLLGTSPYQLLLDMDVYAATLCEKVRYWLEESKQNWGEWGSNRKMAGHVRHAFVMAVWFLRHPEIEYETAIRMVLLRGGDTDTNAAIVGGLVACYQTIPSHLIEKLRSFDSTLDGRWPYRPKEYCVKYQMSL